MKAKIIALPRQKSRTITVKRKAPAQLKGPLGDMENFSFARWLLANKELRTLGKATKYNAPYETAYYAKAQAELNGQDGGFLAPAEWRKDYFKVLRGGLILNKLDTNIYTTKYRVTHIPFGVQDWTWNYLGDNAPATDVSRAFGQIKFAMHKGMAFSSISNELIRDASDVADEWLKKDAASSAAHEIDRQALFGSGQLGTPTGVVNQSNISQVALYNDSGNGATPTYWDLTNGIKSVEILGNTALIIGGAAECNGIIAAPGFAVTIGNMVLPGGNPPWLYGLSNKVDMPNQPRLFGVENWVTSALVPAGITKGTSIGNTSYIIYGDWRYFALMLRTDFEFSLSDQPLAQNDQSAVKTVIRYDSQTIFPFAFAVQSGVLI